MNLTAPQPEGSLRTADTYLDHMAVSLPGNAAGSHWACGMPLSYVQEMAGQWLSLHDQAARTGLLFDRAGGYGDDSSANAK